jgi:hypothetical protein
VSGNKLSTHAKGGGGGAAALTLSITGLKGKESAGNNQGSMSVNHSSYASTLSHSTNALRRAILEVAPIIPASFHNFPPTTSYTSTGRSAAAKTATGATSLQPLSGVALSPRDTYMSFSRENYPRKIINTASYAFVGRSLMHLSEAERALIVNGWNKIEAKMGEMMHARGVLMSSAPLQCVTYMQDFCMISSQLKSLTSLYCALTLGVTLPRNSQECAAYLQCYQKNIWSKVVKAKEKADREFTDMQGAMLLGGNHGKNTDNNGADNGQSAQQKSVAKAQNEYVTLSSEIAQQQFTCTVLTDEVCKIALQKELDYQSRAHAHIMSLIDEVGFLSTAGIGMGADATSNIDEETVMVTYTAASSGPATAGGAGQNSSVGVGFNNSSNAGGGVHASHGHGNQGVGGGVGGGVSNNNTNNNSMGNSSTNNSSMAGGGANFAPLQRQGSMISVGSTSMASPTLTRGVSRANVLPMAGTAAPPSGGGGGGGGNSAPNSSNNIIMAPNSFGAGLINTAAVSSLLTSGDGAYGDLVLGTRAMRREDVIDGFLRIIWAHGTLKDAGAGPNTNMMSMSSYGINQPSSGGPPGQKDMVTTSMNSAASVSNNASGTGQKLLTVPVDKFYGAVDVLAKDMKMWGRAYIDQKLKALSLENQVLYICIYIYIYVCVRMCVCGYAGEGHEDVGPCVYRSEAQGFVAGKSGVCICTHVCVYVIYVYIDQKLKALLLENQVCVYVYIYIYTHTHICLCMLIYIHIHTNTHAYIHINSHTHTHIQDLHYKLYLLERNCLYLQNNKQQVDNLSVYAYLHTHAHIHTHTHTYRTCTTNYTYSNAIACICKITNK